jgi:predicted transcriptional regulator
MRKSKLDQPHIKEQVVKELATGRSQAQIAKEVGISASQVCRFANRENIKPFIEKEQMRLLEVVPDAVENVKELVKEMKDIPKSDTKRRELSYKASTDVLKAVGLMPTPIQSQVITNIYNQQNNVFISPVVQALLDKYLQDLEDIKKNTKNDA